MKSDLEYLRFGAPTLAMPACLPACTLFGRRTKVASLKAPLIQRRTLRGVECRVCMYGYGHRRAGSGTRAEASMRRRAFCRATAQMCKQPRRPATQRARKWSKPKGKGRRGAPVEQKSRRQERRERSNTSGCDAFFSPCTLHSKASHLARCASAPHVNFACAQSAPSAAVRWCEL